MLIVVKLQWQQMRPKYYGIYEYDGILWNNLREIVNRINFIKTKVLAQINSFLNIYLFYLTLT